MVDSPNDFERPPIPLTSLLGSLVGILLPNSFSYDRYWLIDIIERLFAAVYMMKPLKFFVDLSVNHWWDSWWWKGNERVVYVGEFVFLRDTSTSFMSMVHMRDRFKSLDLCSVSNHIAPSSYSVEFASSLLVIIIMEWRYYIVRIAVGCFDSKWLMEAVTSPLDCRVCTLCGPFHTRSTLSRRASRLDWVVCPYITGICYPYHGRHDGLVTCMDSLSDVSHPHDKIYLGSENLQRLLGWDRSKRSPLSFWSLSCNVTRLIVCWLFRGSRSRSALWIEGISLAGKRRSQRKRSS